MRGFVGTSNASDIESAISEYIIEEKKKYAKREVEKNV